MHFTETIIERLFFWLFVLLYSAYIITFLGIINIDFGIISQIRDIIAGFACVLLLIRFNPLVKHLLSSFDRTLIFTVAGFLLFNIIISELVKYDSSNPIVGYFGKR